MKRYPKSNIRLAALLLCQFLLLGCATAVAPNQQQERDQPVAEEGYFTNPIADGADPWVIKKEGMYYFCSASHNAIYISKSAKLTELGQKVAVWETPDSGWNKSNVWAPELHHLNGKWYIYYAAAQKAGAPFLYQRSGVLESEADDPFGPYRDKGMLYTGDSIQYASAAAQWAIDLTTLKLNGQLYSIWSGWEKQVETDRTKQYLYMATMRNPWTISSNRVRISSPEQPWETGGELDLNEGPQVLKHQGKVFIIYSTRESWLKEYRLGQLTLSDTLLNPMQPENWEKTGPVFQGTAEVMGVGHCSFTTSPDGTENWLLYHSKKSSVPGWARDIRAQEFEWQPDGSPEFGEPVPAGVPIPVPAGQQQVLHR
ncbi:glycoside hydrolase family 43 protein [Pontibacter sp. E15-1]|uniref:glycoside hydrolase family 43 protein n=1 Tax=Pontibacter sp. E15-1 TaxID=2919918 RepID=UPI001F4F233D|nr:glycoside hydrolase family 43 protein [Pontibacter sp. E15-1]MCJ8167000.1 glycoside hydrolase family 43 protein [Pontibacter sp. E15-1]